MLPSMPVFYRNKCIRKGRCQGFISLYHLYKVKHTLRRLCPNCLRIVSINTSPSCFCFVFLLLLFFLFFFFFFALFSMEKVSIPSMIVRDKVCVKFRFTYAMCYIIRLFGNIFIMLVYFLGQNPKDITFNLVANPWLLKCSYLNSL